MSEFFLSESSLAYADKDLERLKVRIRGEDRVPRYTEPLSLPENIYEQARVFGKEVLIQSKRLVKNLQDVTFRQKQGLSDSVYQERVRPFLDLPNYIAYFGADGVIDAEGNVRFVEINSQPQVLGRFDFVRHTLGVR